jgi:Flp pilus assembly protein TadG
MVDPKTARRRHARGWKRPRKEGGAVLVEFALVAPLLFLLLFGVIDFSLMMFSYISVRQGTSAGAREAAVIATSPPPNQTCTTAGTFSGEANNLICYTKNHIGLAQSNVRVSVWFSTTNGYKAGDPVVVCTQYPASSTTRFFNSLLKNLVLTSKVEVRIESTDPNLTQLAQESALPGHPWPSSCMTP